MRRRRCGGAAASAAAGWQRRRASARARGAMSSRQEPSSPPSSSSWPLWLMVDGAPAVDHGVDHVAVRRRAGRDAGVAAGLAGRPQRRRQFAELHPRRQRHAGAEREHLAGAERGNEGQQARAGVRDRRADQRLVAVVRQPHHEQGAALGDDVGIDLGRTLRHEAEEHAVFAAFLGDARQRAPGRAEADLESAGA